jgi:hypothetical protein
MLDVFDDPEIAATLVEHLGFDAVQALACEDAVRRLLAERMNEWIEHVPDAIEQGVALWDAGEVPVPKGLELGPGRTRERVCCTDR